MSLLYAMSRVDDGQLQAIQKMEAEMGCSILALSAIDVEEAKVSDSQLEKLRKLEQDIGVMLVAVKDR